MEISLKTLNIQSTRFSRQKLAYNEFFLSMLANRGTVTVENTVWISTASLLTESEQLQFAMTILVPSEL